MEQADTEAVRDMLQDGTEQTLAQMMEEDEATVDTGTSSSSTETPQLTARILSQVLGICDTAKDEICVLVTGNEEVENKQNITCIYCILVCCVHAY